MTNWTEIIEEYQKRLRSVQEQLAQLSATEQQLVGALKLAAQIREMEKQAADKAE